ncbi:MAG TPA: hypothetical protein VG317_21340 [Pseudonocardiaceae bacterium]|jgi:hypothetical protein|nr:hypothetical protein [Pseudonocardiaceae bacterium]
MATASYSVADIDQARQAIGGSAGKFGSVSDGIPQNVDAGMFGTLGNSGAVAQAVSALCDQLRTEYTKAESLVGAIERALDTTGQNHTNTEQINAQSFRIQQR